MTAGKVASQAAPEVLGRDDIRRRGFLQAMVFGCAAACGVRVWQVAIPPIANDPATRLAQRIVQALGLVMGPAPTALAEPSLPARTIAQLVSEVLGRRARAALPDRADDLHRALLLSDAELKQLLTMRIQQDYQWGAMVHYQGWWLACSEAAILQLSSLLTAQTVRA